MINSTESMDTYNDRSDTGSSWKNLGTDRPQRRAMLRDPGDLKSI